jgi:predicted ArsR family transcriptional regulator
MNYPETPGYKKAGTSKDAADSMREKAPTLRDRVLEHLTCVPDTADGCAYVLGKTIMAVRPRLSELFKLGKIADTGKTEPNESGRMATVWRAV